jgi:hypothetical protein
VKLPISLDRFRFQVASNRLPGFDPIYYRYWYRDIAHFGAGARAHYLQFGWREGRDPSVGFSTDGYLAANPDVAAAKINPLIHFLEHGFAEGRSGYQKDLRAPAPAPRAINPPMKLLAPPIKPKD